MNENQHQIAVMKWSRQPSIRAKYPELKLLHHVANERQCSPAMGKLLKLMGVKRGVPDLDLPVARGAFHGLRIEMKDEKGKPTADQMWWITELIAQGYSVSVCNGWQAAVKTLEWYFNLS